MKTVEAILTGVALMILPGPFLWVIFRYWGWPWWVALLALLVLCGLVGATTVADDGALTPDE